jgi:acyl-CoA hydrolase
MGEMAMLILDKPADLDFSAYVRESDMVVCTQALAEPVALTEELVRQRHRIGHFRMFIGPSYARTFLPEHGDRISFLSYCATGNNRPLMTAGALDILPTHYSELPETFASGRQPADVAILLVSEPDAQGRFNLGINMDYTVAAARRARTVILEISDRVPWVYGAELPDDIRPAIAVRTGREPLALKRAGLDEASDAERAIARHVCALVPDGATIEMGIGALPDLVIDGLRERRDLGLHSGVITDAAVDLMQSGAMTNARKPLNVGVAVAGLLFGSRRLYDFVHRNPAIRLMPPDYTHSVDVARQLPNFYALNGAMEVDLSGQVNSESMSGRYVGAIGGQVDCTRCGNASPDGRAVIMLPSVSRDGRASRIVPRLEDAVVTTARSDAGTIVTEWGVAELRGKSLRERAAALIEIAHPDFRSKLHQAIK